MIDLMDIIKVICQRNYDALEYATEPWVMSELYAELKKQVDYAGWKPFPFEMPYVTSYPIRVPNERVRDWKISGGVKWADLCVYKADGNHWHWFEAKSDAFQEQKRHRLSGINAFCKDLGALIGFSIEHTADTWEHPDEYSKDYMFELLKMSNYANIIRTGTHHFTCAYIQIRGELDQALQSKNNLLNRVQQWILYRESQRGKVVVKALPDIKLSQGQTDNGVWIVLAQWQFQKSA